jgi:two-component system, cell cycle response regulator
MPMLLSREELVATLFRETDRAQRMKSPLGLVYFGIEAAPNLRLEVGQPAFDAAVQDGLRRVLKLLRCYDSLGQIAEGEFVLVLPGCNGRNAAAMAGRIDAEAFASSAGDGDEQIALRGCYGVAASKGRSPFVVLREAEGAFRKARAQGAGTVEICDMNSDSSMPLIPVVEQEGLHW